MRKVGDFFLPAWPISAGPTLHPTHCHR